MQTLSFVSEERFAVEPDELWPLVSDTQRLNQAIGLQAVQYTQSSRPEGGSVLTGEFRKWGMLWARWTEHAFDFVKPEHYRVLREYSVGMLISLDGGVVLTPESGGVRVTVWADIVPRNQLGWAVAKWWVGPASTGRVIAQCRIFEGYIHQQRANAFPQLEVDAEVDNRRLDELAVRLKSDAPDSGIVDRLVEMLRKAPDDRVFGMRPFELADRWGVDRHETLVVFLRATTAGLLDLHWDVLCPNCRIPKARYGRLQDLQEQAHCETCNITFDANFDRLVEVRFTVCPSIRTTNVGIFCVGGPQNVPHVLAQVELSPSTSVEWPIPAGGKAYRLRSAQSAGAAILEVDDLEKGPTSFAVTASGFAPPSARVAPGHAALRIENRLETTAVVALEQQFWPDTAATAAVVSTLQDFRDLFSSEVLAPGMQIGIERLTICFSDLAGSTALYEQLGQARAFRLVHVHFHLLEDAVRSNRGAVVKTIGDAVMAVFSSANAALAAAIAMQRSMRDLNAVEGFDLDQLLKIGIHCGPCVAVNLNDRLDYFGTTVNMAARTQHEARGGEILLTDYARLEPGVDDIIQAEAGMHESFEVMLRGIGHPVVLHRLSAFAAASPSPSSAVGGQPTFAASDIASPTA
ncbi:MAG: hypothetical protein HW416_1210 [Chloroflexi bacterium]|nr:hypothetical protein [Chloroflexota bacterium]